MKNLGTVSPLLFVLALLLVSFAGCGKNDNSVDANGQADLVSNSESYRYQFSLNGCDTQAHTFDSLAALCRGLQDSGLNQGCATSMREAFFVKKGCTGTFKNG